MGGKVVSCEFLFQFFWHFLSQLLKLFDPERRVGGWAIGQQRLRRPPVTKGQPCHPTQCNAMPSNAMKCYPMQCNAMSSYAMPSNAMPCHPMQCHAIQCNAMPSNIMQCNAMQCKQCNRAARWMQYNVVQFNANPWKAMQCNECNTMQSHTM